MSTVYHTLFTLYTKFYSNLNYYTQLSIFIYNLPLLAPFKSAVFFLLGF